MINNRLGRLDEKHEVPKPPAPKDKPKPSNPIERFKKGQRSRKPINFRPFEDINKDIVKHKERSGE